jgi:hypothetical protein
MYHRLWTLLNIALVAISIIYIWFFRPHDSSLVISSQLLAQVGVVLFFININMYFIFLVIRKTSVRNVKIRLAKISRYIMKWHIKIGLAGTAVILGHAIINFSEFGPVVGYTHLKLITGYMAVAFLGVTLFAGYLRHKKASGFRRRFHLVSAFVFFTMFLIHMFITIG